jgi:hypothetical protein
LVGLDVDPDGLRGRGLDFIVISEAGFVRGLKSTVLSVLYPQLQGRPHARILLESSAPKDPRADFDETFIPDAKLRKAYCFRTIEDNPLLSRNEKDEFIAAAGGKGAPECDREYFGLRVRDLESTVVPEFDVDEHVREVPTPQFADCYVSLDPGFKDLCAVLFGYWDFENARLVVQRDWAELNASAATIAEAITQIEGELWSGLQRWTGKEFKPNPYLRVSDTDPRLMQDLAREHGLRVVPVNKSTGAKTELKEAAVHSLRGAIGRGQILIDPKCTTLIAHLEGAQWNDQRTDYRRHPIHKHYDCLDALVYMWRSIVRNKSATPPGYIGKPHDQLAAGSVPRDRPVSNAAKVLEQMFSSSRRDPIERGRPSPIRRGRR